MLSINGKKFLNLPEAVQWLLDNNALPFQSTANYVADTVIAKTSIVNPSPAEIRIGSLVLFADGKVGTVSGITANGFMVGAESTDLSDGVPHITDIQIDASQHLIFTMSEGDPIDAGLVKEVSSFSIDASQHLIVHYNDGTTQDLGAIFQGNVNIAGNLTADSIVENMSGYSAQYQTVDDLTIENVYVGAVKNGNKLTMVIACNLTRTAAIASSKLYVSIGIPEAVGNKLYPTPIAGYSALSMFIVNGAYGSAQTVPLKVFCDKSSNGRNVRFYLQGDTIDDLPLNTKTYVRVEQTFLLSDGLI